MTATAALAYLKALRRAGRGGVGSQHHRLAAY
jgi:hypothetical protein